MTKEKPIKPVNLRLPATLINEFHRVAKRFGVKERTLAAAVAMYCAADEKTQLQWYLDVGSLYGEASQADQEPEQGPADVGQAIEDQRAAARQQRRSAKGRG